VASLLVFAVVGEAQESPRTLDIVAVRKQGVGTAEGRAAWDRLIQGDAQELLPILRAMPATETSASNWLRTAFERIVERQLAAGKRLPMDALLNFACDARELGRARRLALDVVEEQHPGTSAKLFADWLGDPEFRYEAVAVTLAKGREALKQSDGGAASVLIRQAFAASRDVQQARDAAAALEKVGVKVSVGEHLGFLMEWYLIGPFDAQAKKGFRFSYSPEKNVDLKETLIGQAGKRLRWVRYHATEPPHTSGGRHQALINLAEKDALGNADDAVAYAYTEFSVAKAGEAEFRGAADDNLTVWVNGNKEFAFEEWRNGVRLDRHRFKVMLREGKNTVLVKVCQTPAPNPEPNWEFFLRVVDATGKGIAMKNALP
jgi:hypothetical protein